MDAHIRKVYVPMTETGFYILYCLQEEMHGYNIGSRVKAMTCGEVTISPGTMYGTVRGNGTMADKKEMKIFTLSEYEEEEQYLNKMARSGYLFEKVTLPGIYHFRKTAPVNMIYRIDFNPKKKEEWDSYLQMYQDYGWTYIQDLNEYSYFCKMAAGDEEENEIFSDNQSRIDMMDRIIKGKMIPVTAVFLCCVIPQAVRMADGMYTDRVSIAFYILWVILIVLYVYLIARSTAGFARLRKKYAVEK